MNPLSQTTRKLLPSAIPRNAMHPKRSKITPRFSRNEKQSRLLHKLNRWPGGMRDRLLLRRKDIRDGAGRSAGILDRDGRKISAVTLLNRRKDNRPAIASCPVQLCGVPLRAGEIVGHFRLFNSLCIGVSSMRIQLVECGGEVIGVDLLVRGVLVLTLPSVGR